jgi:xanthine dehydrogenase YagR molybdenum-binding subunit
MLFDQPAGANPIDRESIVGKDISRIDGSLKVTGKARYAYERQDAGADAVYGYIVPAAIAKGEIVSIDLDDARKTPGFLGAVTYENAGALGKGKYNFTRLLAGPAVDHYHQAVAVVVAETFEQAREAAGRVKVAYKAGDGAFDLERAYKDRDGKPAKIQTDPADTAVGDFERAFAQSAVKLDETYTTPAQSHAMMEPHATTARWDGDKLTVWTASQMVDWHRTDLAKTLGVEKDNVRLISNFIGGGFGGKLFLRSDALLASLAARQVGRPVKLALTRPTIFNNTTHRSQTIQRIRIGADEEGKIGAIAHEGWSGNVGGGKSEGEVAQTRLLYAGANRETQSRLAKLDLPEANSMRAPGEAPGMMALEIAVDELAERLKLDPIELRVRNDVLHDPEHPERPFSSRQLKECLQTGAEKFGWSKRRAEPRATRDGDWLVGYGVASAFRNHQALPSSARVRLMRDGGVVVETDMTDIGTGSYTIIAQTAAETMGVDLSRVSVRLGDSDFPVSCGSGGQFGAANATSGVYAACMVLRAKIADKLGIVGNDVDFRDGQAMSGGKSLPITQAATDQLSTFGAHFVEVGVDAYTAEIRVRRMLAVCASGRILNPKTARSQVIGAMTMGVGAALVEELRLDKARGFFVNHDLAGYEVPVHADIPHLDVVFIDEPDPIASVMKAKGVGELGLSGAAAAVSNAVYNATGVRVRDYPVTLDKLLDRMPTAT